MTTVSHAPGRHYEVRGHRLWVETRLEFCERSGSFSHVEEPETVFALVREFTGR